MTEPVRRSLQDRVIIVTGAGQGIGLGIVERLVAHGAIVVVNDLVEARAAEVEKMVAERGGIALAIGGDVSSEEDVKQLIDKTVDELGPIDAVVNNAGALCNKPFLEHSLQDWDRVFAVNTRGTFLVTKFALPEMIKRRRGCIVNTASISSQITTRDHVAYAASKAGIVTMTRDIAAEVAPFGVRVNAVSPGPIGQGTVLLQDEPHHGIILPYAGKIGDIGEAVAFLASDAARFITGETLVVAGGANIKAAR